MRNFRTAAVAAATAVTVAFSGTAIASAQEGEGSANNTETTQSSTGSSAWQIGESLEVQDKPTVTGVDLFGSSVDDENNPEWAKLWREGTFVLFGTAVVGAAIGAYNYAVFHNMIPTHIFDGVFGIK